MALGEAPRVGDDDGEALDPTGRRDLMKKVAIGGAVVWAAPAITRTGSAAAAQSVPPIGPFTVYANGGAAGGVTMTTTPSVHAPERNIPAGDAEITGTAFREDNRTPATGTPPDVMTLAIAPVELGPTPDGFNQYGRQTYEMLFSQPVYDVTFSISVETMDRVHRTAVGVSPAETGPYTTDNGDWVDGTRTYTLPGPVLRIEVRHRLTNNDQEWGILQVSPVTFSTEPAGP